MEKSLASVEVRVHGRPLREYLHNAEFWMEGRKGSDFTIRVRNKTWQRILAVVSVDGLSVMDGEEAGFDSGGYVIDACGYIDIPGWRLDDDNVAKFKFHKSAKSYASKKGKKRNVGTIGCAIFTEKVKPVIINTCNMLRSSGFTPTYGGGGTTTASSPPMNQSYGSRGMSSGEESCFYNASNSAPVYGEENCNATLDWCAVPQSTVEPSLGTEFGKKTSHSVLTVNFERASDTPDEKYEIRYADRRELQRRGVDLNQKPVAANRPTAFPKETGCKPPADWRE